ncbi:lactonase family protein [Pengzhenrongella sp.]|uniref:lactonase family protein n=1 Tax=Pengzhenrongella sp. TaxID=2888820 RepID=UPI002F946475
MSTPTNKALTAFVGSYSGAGEPGAGGITVLAVELDGDTVGLRRTSRVEQPAEAGYLAYSAARGTLYAVDERKTDGRGPVDPPASVHAFTVDPADGTLCPLNTVASPGPFPTYLALDEPRGLLISANHGSFEHVEKVERDPDGAWTSRYVYDDSTVVVYRLEEDGSLGAITDLHVMDGHGLDPNTSLQAGGHAQSSAHAHSVVVDPSGRFLLVGDKGADRVLVFRLGASLELAYILQTGAETGPRHLAFDPVDGLVFATFELSSELAVLEFDQASGELRLVATCSTVAGPVGRTNEPADVRIHPAGGLVYVNNRGEDTLAWFRWSNGTLQRLGSVPLAPSIHPGLAARSFALDPSGRTLLLADRPAGLVRAYSVDTQTGELAPAGQVNVAEAAFVLLAELPQTGIRPPQASAQPSATFA